MESVRPIILAHLQRLAGTPQSLGQIFEACDELDDRKQLGAALYNMKKAGTIGQGEDRKYFLTGLTETSPDTPPIREKDWSHPIRGGNGTKPPAAPADPADPVREVLQANIRATREAIDNYIAAVGSPTVFAALLECYEQAQAAEQAYRS